MKERPDGFWVLYAHHEQAVAKARLALEAQQNRLAYEETIEANQTDSMTAKLHSLRRDLREVREALAALSPTDSGK